MFVRRVVPALSKRAILRPAVKRSFAISARRFDSPDGHQKSATASTLITPINDIKSEHDLMPPGAAEGTIPTDLEQATGLERLEILGKMQGVDVFDMKPLDASRHGTLADPIVVKSYGDEQYLGCTGSPADSHGTLWLVTSRERPVERCPECGSVYKMEYVGPADSHDDHHDHHHDQSSYFIHPNEGDIKTIADFVRPEYR